jgi:hypothetical protein
MDIGTPYQKVIWAPIANQSRISTSSSLFVVATTFSSFYPQISYLKTL